MWILVPQSGIKLGPSEQWDHQVLTTASVMISQVLNLYIIQLIFFFFFPFSGQFSHSVMSDSLWPHALQHARLPWPLPTPGVYSNSCPSHLWCHPTISSSVIPFSSYLQSFPTSGTFQMSQFFTSGGQSITVSASASVLPMTIQDWLPSGLTALISLHSKRLSRVFSNITVQKDQSKTKDHKRLLLTTVWQKNWTTWKKWTNY